MSGNMSGMLRIHNTYILSEVLTTCYAFLHKYNKTYLFCFVWLFSFVEFSLYCFVWDFYLGFETKKIKGVCVCVYGLCFVFWFVFCVLSLNLFFRFGLSFRFLSDCFHVWIFHGCWFWSPIYTYT